MGVGSASSSSKSRSESRLRRAPSPLAVTPRLRLCIPSSSANSHQYVLQLLRFQEFDGSFEFATEAETDILLGQSIRSALDQLVDDQRSRRTIYTTAIVVLLERDFAARKGLWELMHQKATAFLDSCGEEYDKIAMVEHLQGLSIPRVLLNEDSDDSQPDDSVSD